MAGADIQPNVDPIRISIVHYDSFDWKLKDGADINRALVLSSFSATPRLVRPSHTRIIHPY